MNNHPFHSKDFVLAHNGMISNDEQLKSKFNLNYKVETDSYVILSMIQKEYSKCNNVVE